MSDIAPDPELDQPELPKADLEEVVQQRGETMVNMEEVGRGC